MWLSLLLLPVYWYAVSFEDYHQLGHLMIKPTKWHVRPAKTQISLGIRPVWSESWLCAQWVAKDLSFLCVDSEDWSDWADAQADLSLRWGLMPFCYAPPPESGGVLCYTLRNFECPSVRPSVRPSAPTTILVSATPPTVWGQSFWNFTGVLRMVWRYAYCFFRILKLFFITFFPFLT